MISNEIVVTNIDNNEIINYPVLLIKGKIIHHNCRSEKKNIEVTLNENESAANYRLKNKQFKVLLELRVGENNIVIRFCCVLKCLKINFLKRNSTHQVVPLYIINKNHNGEFQAPHNVDNTIESAFRRINTAAKLLQCLIAEKLHEDGFGRKTFEVQDCRVFHSNLDVSEVSKMNQRELWEYLGREIMNSEIGHPKYKYLGFVSCTKYTGNKNLIKYEDMVKMTDGYVAIGGGGLALFGTACMYTWPMMLSEVFEKFEDNTPVDSNNFLNDSCYRNTFGACFSTTLGSVLHELSHAFDLGHTDQGVMGRGFDNIHKFFTDLSSEISKPEAFFSEQLLPKSINGFIRNSSSRNTIDSYRKRNDETYFTRSCAALLYYHKYDKKKCIKSFHSKFFNDYSRSPENFILTLDRGTRLVKSTTGIRVIEIRENITELVINSWVFPGKVLKYSFQIPDDVTNRIILVEDNFGNILKDENNALS